MLSVYKCILRRYSVTEIRLQLSSFIHNSLVLPSQISHNLVRQPGSAYILSYYSAAHTTYPMSSLPVAVASTGDQTANEAPANSHHLDRKVRVAYKVQRKYLAPRVDIDATPAGDVVMHEVKQLWDAGMVDDKVWYRVHTLLCEPVVQIGSISTVSHSNPSRITLTDIRIIIVPAGRYRGWHFPP